MELSLVLAGQDKWAEGAGVLEPVLEVADRFPEREQVAAANVFKNFATRLQDTGQSELAKQFELKATELSAVKQDATGQSD